MGYQEVISKACKQQKSLAAILETKGKIVKFNLKKLKSLESTLVSILSNWKVQEKECDHYI